MSRASEPDTDAGLVIETLGDQAVLLRLGTRIDPQLNARVHQLAQALRALPEAQEVVPAYASVCLQVRDPQVLGQNAWLRGLRERALLALAQADAETVAPSAARIELQVDFGSGPDLDEVAERLQLQRADLIARLLARPYQVAMLGFLPGFAYLLGLDPALALPRRSTPRERVPARMLALGGAQLGVYPCASPGGWHLLGTVDGALFDPDRDPPARLQPGATVVLRSA